MPDAIRQEDQIFHLNVISLFQLDSGLSSQSLRKLICKSESELTHSVRLGYQKALKALQRGMECSVYKKNLLIMNP